MEENKKVTIINMINAQVGIKKVDLHFDHTWLKKGDKFNVDYNLLQELMYDTGVKNMFEQGILYIEDMQTKIDLDLEPQGATEPENIIVLNDDQKRRYLTVMPFFEFKERVSKLSLDQCRELAQFAINNQLVDVKKSKFIYERCGINIMKSIEYNFDEDEE